MSSSIEKQILTKSQKAEKIQKPESHRSNKRFRGYLFASIAMEQISVMIPQEKYRLVLGPVWVKDLEYVEWDGAIVKKEAKEICPNYLTPTILPQYSNLKIAGIYGVKKPQKGKKTVIEVMKNINDNFKKARDLFQNIGCFYISLYERKPKDSEKKPINYYSETKKGLAAITTCILFNNRNYKKPEPLDSWADMITKLHDLLK
jgi:hypothetical protein